MHRALPALALALLALAIPATAAEWRVDPARSSIALVVDQGGKPLEARFTRFEAEVAFDPARPEAGRVVVTVDTASFASGTAPLDQIAIGDAFLASKTHPQARYTAGGFTPLGGDRYEVRAELQLRGRTGTLTHPATITTAADGARAVGEVDLARLDWGVGEARFQGTAIGPVVKIRFDLAATPAGP